MDSRGESLSMRVVEAVATAEGVDAEDLSPRLTTVVDPDSLDSLFQNGTGRVSFDYCGYEVTVDADGTVDLTPLAES